MISVLINLKTTGYHMMVLTNRLLIFFEIKNGKPKLQNNIDFILFLKKKIQHRNLSLVIHGMRFKLGGGWA